MVQYPDDLKPKHIKNLKKLSAYLQALPEGYEKFEMNHFFEKDYYCYGPSEIKKKYYSECGTSACALGHGPAAGIKCKDQYTEWSAYSLEKFGLDWYTEEWDWCFASEWSDFDNTPQGAGKRIDYFLTHGVPHEFYDSRWGWDGLLDYQKV